MTPTGGRLLLDTNAAIALFRRDASLGQLLATAVETFVPSVALGELYYGAYKSSRTAANLARVQRFATASRVLRCDIVTARHYGQIKNGLRAKGRPIPENDIWIASIAEQYQLTLVSRDEHFKHIDDLAVVSW